MRRAFLLGLPTALLLLPILHLLSACGVGPVPARCDSDILEESVAILEHEDPPEDAEAQAIELLKEACPRMDPGVMYGLEFDYAQGAADLMLHITATDESYGRQRRKTCANPDEWMSKGPELPREDRAAAMFEICDFGRFGLFEEGETYFGGDLSAIQVYGWFDRNIVDADLARRFVRGIMTSSASTAILENRCRRRPGTGACIAMIGREGEAAPSTNWKIGPGASEGLVILTTSKLVSLLGETVDELGGRDLKSSGPESHLFPELKEGIQTKASARKDESSDSSLDTVLLAASSRTRARTLVDAMYTANAVGYSEFRLMATFGSDTIGLPIAPPPRWASSDEIRSRDSAATVVSIGGDRLRFEYEGEEFGSAPLSEETRILELARTLSQKSKSDLVEIRLQDESSVEQLVRIADLLRGPSCEFQDYMDESQGECLFVRVIPSLERGIPRVGGDWDALTLSVTTSSGGFARRRGAMKPAKVEQRIRASFPAIQRCLTGEADARAVRPEEIILLIGKDPHGDFSVLVFPESAPGVPRGCIRAALDLPNPNEQAQDFYMEARIGVSVP